MAFASLTPIVSLLLIPLLIAPPGWSQSSSAGGAIQSGTLQLRVLDSDGPQVAVNSHGGKGFSLQVIDGNGVGVPDAAVAIRLPDSGATGLFVDGSHSAVVYTDASGRAHVEGVQWNGVAGAMAVRVTATKGDQHAGILIEQTLIAGAGPSLPPPRPEAPAAPIRIVPAPVPEESAPLNSIAPSAESVPARPAMRASGLGPGVAVLRSAEPSVSISNDGAGPAYHGGGSKKKWIILGLTIAAGAGAAFAIMSMGKASTAASSSTISIGAPTVSVGHP